MSFASIGVILCFFNSLHAHDKNNFHVMITAFTSLLLCENKSFDI